MQAVKVLVVKDTAHLQDAEHENLAVRKQLTMWALQKEPALRVTLRTKCRQFQKKVLLETVHSTYHLDE